MVVDTSNSKLTENLSGNKGTENENLKTKNESANSVNKNEKNETNENSIDGKVETNGCTEERADADKTPDAIEDNEKENAVEIEKVNESTPMSKPTDDSAVGDSMNSDSLLSPEDDEEQDDYALNGDDHSGEKLSKTNLYIRGLGSDFNDRKLNDLCKRFGQIVSTKAIMHKQSFVCKGYGFVDFSSEEEAKRAVIELQKEGIPAQMARQQEQDLTNIYISNLPRGFDEKKLEEVFQNLGTVVSTRILRDQSGNTKKVGFVRMETQEMCEKVIAQVHNKPLEGYPECKLLCKFADAGKRRKPMYAGGGSYDHYDAYHQHNHHNSYYSNHQSAYTPYYANFPKGFNQGPPSNTHPSLNGNSPAGVPWSPASGAAFNLNPLASTGALNYYNLLFGGVANNGSSSGPTPLLSANPLAAAATLGGAPYFQNHSAAAAGLGGAAAVSSAAAVAGGTASAVANSAIGHSPSSSAPSFLLNSANHNQFSEASNAHNASQQPNNTTIASLAQSMSNAHHHNQHQPHGGSNAGGQQQQGGNSHQGSLVGSMNGSVDLGAAALYQQQSNAQQQQLISNLSHSMNHLHFNQRHHNSQPGNGGGNVRGSNSLFYQQQQQNNGISPAVQAAALLNGASSPLDNPNAAAAAQNGFHSGNTPPSDELHLKGPNGFLNGSGNSNGFNGQMNFSSSGNGNQYWAALQQQNGSAAGVPQNPAAVAAYAAALNGALVGGTGNSGPASDQQQSSQNSANGSAANGLHMIGLNGGGGRNAAGGTGASANTPLQY